MSTSRDNGERAPSPVLREEEHAQIQMYEDIYRKERPSDLVLKERAWTRFREAEPELNAYVASVHRLGAIAGRKVLDVGCGDGWLSVILAKLGARVVGFDISREGVRLCRDRARANQVEQSCFFVAASAYALPFRDGALEVAMGQGVLHHVQYKTQAAGELARVLPPGAVAVFAEPFGNALWLERLRLMVPVVSGSPEDPDEWKHQFKYADAEPFRADFEVQMEEFQFFSRLDRVVRNRGLVKLLGRIDRLLLRFVPALRPLAREIVVVLRRRP